MKFMIVLGILVCSFLTSVCMFIVSKTLLISSATVFAQVLFNVCSVVTVEFCTRVAWVCLVC